MQRGLDLDGEDEFDYFGHSVSLSSDGGVIAIGGYGDDSNGSLSGAARIFSWSGSAWVLKGNELLGEAAGDGFGTSVSLSSNGDVVAIGGYTNDGNGSNSGYVQVFNWDGTSWVQKGVDIDGANPGDFAGMSVSLSSDGDIVAVGSPGNDDNGSSSGCARIFVWNGTVWVQRGAAITGERAGDSAAERLGLSMSGDGNTVAIGARLNDDNGSNSGNVRVFTWNAAAWVQKGVDIDGEAADNYSGYGMCLSRDGQVVAIGAPGNNGSRGHARVYAWNGAAWVQRGIDLDGDAANDNFGWSVSLSNDGGVVAVGAYRHGSSRGHVRVYSWDGAAWVQQGTDIDGEATGDTSGTSVALSSDGGIVAIGAPGNDANGSSSGHARVFYLSGPSSAPTASPTAVPTSAAPTTSPTVVPSSAVPTTVPTAPVLEPVVIESAHKYAPNTREVWTASFPGVTCYSLTMAPQSWTPEPADFVRIFGVTTVEDGDDLVSQVTGQRLFKRRLLTFGTRQVAADFIRVEFVSDGDKEAWGFRLTIEEC